LYVKPALQAVRAGGVHALAHITGGGLTENLPRVLPENLGAEINLDAWDMPGVFKWMADIGSMAEPEMLKTFNCGVGMILVVSADQADSLKSLLNDAGETVYEMGRVTAGAGIDYSGQLL
jgi:phosphoribosylformylglycinamidine cyclo-ligase